MTPAPTTTQRDPASIKHPFYDHSLKDALNLARSLKYHPLPKKEDPTPDPEEALELVKTARANAGFNWITGRVAEEVLRHALGEENPFTT